MPSNAVIAGMMLVLSTASTSIDTAIENAVPVTQTVTKSPHAKPRTQKTQTVYATISPSQRWEYVDEGEEGESVVSDQQEESSEGQEISEETVNEDIPMEPGSIPGVSLEEERRFDQLSQCESGGDWHINTGNGYFGGIQFSQGSWEAAGGLEFAQRADLATREQQIMAGKKLKDMQGWNAWPSCSRKYGYI